VERRIVLDSLFGSIGGAMVSHEVEAKPINTYEANK
jgi:hypothetical protein